MLPYNRFIKRVEREREFVRKYLPSFKEIKVTKNNVTWKGKIHGPPESVYAGGVFEIEIKLTRHYPLRPPVVKWWTPTWHPNISSPVNKPPPYAVCISVLSTKWVPSLTIPDVVEALRVMLSKPNPRSPLNPLAGRQLLFDPEAFRRNVKKYLKTS